ncbi:mitochondrial fission process protein 1-like [Physella acuta]|uniref:mitochondrial fission process protein 1-like n=1 Tax=Physella acuta TaxID=109671 RepID=UPI0027DDB42B|nr:mitochondrial fission process protein 1-like [Physella acuta]
MADPFMFFPLRALGYGYAIGVGLRYRFCDELQNSCKTFGLTFVMCHVAHSIWENTDLPKSQVAIIATDALIFDALSSLLIPTLITYYVSHTCRSILKNSDNVPKPMYKWGPLLSGLLALCLSVRPVNALVNVLMDSTIRNCYVIPVTN